MAEPLFEFPPGVDEPGLSARRRRAKPATGFDDRAEAKEVPRWLRRALAKRNLRPRGGWPPIHHLLTERDLPSEEEEDEKVSVSTAHDEFTRGLCTGLVSRYRQREDVFVAHDLFVYFDRGRRGRVRPARLSPDLFVSFDAPKRLRGSYVVWQESKPPDFVLEILSDSTWRKDVKEKPGLYRRMGVREYFLFDPHEHIRPLLRAWRFGEGRLPVTEVAAGMRGVYSEVLGLHLCHTAPWLLRHEGHPDAGLLRWHDPAAGRLLETASDMERRADEMERRANEVERRAAEEAREMERRANEVGRRAAERVREVEQRANEVERRAAERVREMEQRANEVEQRASEVERRAAEKAREVEQRANEVEQRADEVERRTAEEARARRALESRVAALEEQLRGR